MGGSAEGGLHDAAVSKGAGLVGACSNFQVKSMVLKKLHTAALKLFHCQDSSVISWDTETRSPHLLLPSGSMLEATIDAILLARLFVLLVKLENLCCLGLSLAIILSQGFRNSASVGPVLSDRSR